MRRTGSLWAGLLILTLLTSACGSRVAPQRELAAQTPTSPGGSPLASPPAVESTSEAPHAAPQSPPPDVESYPDPDDPLTPPPDDDDESWWRPGPQPPPPGHNTVRVETSAACVTPGSLVRITVHTDRPRSQLALTVGYSDYHHHGSMAFGQADDAGRFVWPLTIPADAPPGEARALVSASGRDSAPEGGGTGSKAFMVAAPGAC